MKEALTYLAFTITGILFAFAGKWLAGPTGILVALITYGLMSAIALIVYLVMERYISHLALGERGDLPSSDNARELILSEGVDKPKLLLVTFGFTFVLLSLGADWLGLGVSPGFGWKQISGLLLGVASLIAGFLRKG